LTCKEGGAHFDPNLALHFVGARIPIFIFYLVFLKTRDMAELKKDGATRRLFMGMKQIISHRFFRHSLLQLTHFKFRRLSVLVIPEKLPEV
jgi:hypothetical protein